MSENKFCIQTQTVLWRGPTRISVCLLNSCSAKLTLLEVRSKSELLIYCNLQCEKKTGNKALSDKFSSNKSKSMGHEYPIYYILFLSHLHLSSYCTVSSFKIWSKVSSLCRLGTWLQKLANCRREWELQSFV